MWQGFRQKNKINGDAISLYTATLQQQLATLECDLQLLKDVATDQHRLEIDQLITYYIPLIDGLKLTYQGIEQAHKIFNEPSLSFRSFKQYRPNLTLETLEDLTKKIKDLERKHPHYFWRKWQLKRLKRKQGLLQNQVTTFSQSESSLPDVFQEIEKLQKLLAGGLAQSEKHLSQRHHDRKWQQELEFRQVNQVWTQWELTRSTLELSRLSQEQLALFNDKDPILFYQLYYKDGWDFPAIIAFNNYLIAQLSTTDNKESLTVIESLLIERQKIGSPIYHILFKNSEYQPSQKIDLMLNQLGATIDSYSMLQLTGPFAFDIKMAPHSLFIELFCQTVQLAYHNQMVDSYKVHQLRMYFDRQNLFYIRHEFPSETDAESLRRYVASPFPKGLNNQPLLRERARYHNKAPKGSDFISYHTQSPNIKRLTPNFHSEFILDKKGHFVSQWNVLKINNGLVESNPSAYEWTTHFEQQLLNTESLNYGSKNNTEHKRLDSLPPVYFDHQLRNIASKKWASPSHTEYSFRKVDKRRNRSI